MLIWSGKEPLHFNMFHHEAFFPLIHKQAHLGLHKHDIYIIINDNMLPQQVKGRRSSPICMIGQTSTGFGFSLKFHIFLLIIGSTVLLLKSDIVNTDNDDGN